MARPHQWLTPQRGGVLHYRWQLTLSQFLTRSVTPATRSVGVFTHVETFRARKLMTPWATPLEGPACYLVTGLLRTPRGRSIRRESNGAETSQHIEFSSVFKDRPNPNALLAMNHSACLSGQRASRRYRA